MEKPILTLSTKDFLTGIAPNAHTERGGLFYTAAGVTPVYDPGGTASVENGLLQPGPAPTNYSGSVVVDNPIASVAGFGNSNTPYLFFLGSSGHFYRKALGSGDVTDLRSGTPISNPANGMAIWKPVGGTKYLYYWQTQQIGVWDLSGTYATGWNDDGPADDLTGLANTTAHPVHPFLDRVYFGNDTKIGALLDNGASSYSFSLNVLDVKSTERVYALSDDTTFLVAAATDNVNADNRFAVNTIYFWDTYSSSWNREYIIRDPFIWALKRIGRSVYAFGQYGIYEVTYDAGPRKLLSRLIGFGTTADLNSGYGANRAAVYNQTALMFATDSTIDTFGPLSPDLPAAYYKSFKVPSGVGTPTLVDALFDVGRVYIGTDGGKIYGYDFNGSTRETSVSAQTIYFPIRQKIEITRIDVVFGEPLASGDAMSVQLKTDEDTAVTPTTALTATYSADGAIRRKSVRVAKYFTESPLSLVINFTSGAVKIKEVQVFGNGVETET